MTSTVWTQTAATRVNELDLPGTYAALDEALNEHAQAIERVAQHDAAVKTTEHETEIMQADKLSEWRAAHADLSATAFKEKFKELWTQDEEGKAIRLKLKSQHVQKSSDEAEAEHAKLKVYALRARLEATAAALQIIAAGISKDAAIDAVEAATVAAGGAQT